MRSERSPHGLAIGTSAYTLTLYFCLQEAELELAEVKMLRFSLGVTRMDRISSEIIRETKQTGRLIEKAREARLRCFGHAQRRDSGPIGRRMLEMELPCRRQRGRPRRRYMDAVKRDMQVVGVRVEDTENRLK